MSRLAIASVFLLLACQSAPKHAPVEEVAGSGGESGEGGEVAGSGGSVNPRGMTGGSGGTGGASEPDAASGGSGDTPDAAGAVDASADALMSMLDGGGDGGDYDILPGRPYIHLCKKDWTKTQCCAFLCACLNEHCTDAPRAVPGIATCMPTCLKLSDMTMRCHVYHCYEAKGPDFVDHESHCAHAANTLNGGSCPTGVY